MDPREFNHSAFRTHVAPGEQRFRVSLELNIADVEALWQAAFVRAMEAPGACVEDVEEVLGPIQDPDVSSCIAMLAAPGPIAGCSAESFAVKAVPVSPGSYTAIAA